MKFFIKKILKFFRYLFIKHFYHYAALNNIDKKMKKYLNYENGYFIELGANDGINQSNTFFFEKKKNWKGVLIEPNKNNFIKCKKNRSKYNKFYQAACVANNKIKNLNMFYADLMTTDIANKKKNKYYQPHINLDNTYKFKVKTDTLNNILDKSKAPKTIDFFSLDVERAEIEVLKGINFADYKFKYILIETKKFKKIKNFLFKKKYHFLERLAEHDYLFKLNKYQK